LPAAKKRQDDARIMQKEWDALWAKISDLCPPPMYGARRDKSIEAHLDRLLQAANSHSSIERSIADHEQQIAQKEQRIREIEQQAEQKAEHDASVKAMANDAVAFLLAHGKSPGADFDVTDAVAAANVFAFDLEVQKQKKVLQFHEFDGSDGCENCSGWDGVSNRCNCGNRRVCWTADECHSFRKPIIRPEAH
jgi:hypothetical protein